MRCAQAFRTILRSYFDITGNGIVNRARGARLIQSSRKIYLYACCVCCVQCNKFMEIFCGKTIVKWAFIRLFLFHVYNGYVNCLCSWEGNLYRFTLFSGLWRPECVTIHINAEYKIDFISKRHNTFGSRQQPSRGDTDSFAAHIKFFASFYLNFLIKNWTFSSYIRNALTDVSYFPSNYYRKE